MDNFEILSIIGEGAFGSVSKARNIKTNEIVAIKEVDLDQLEDTSINNIYVYLYYKWIYLCFLEWNINNDVA